METRESLNDHLRAIANVQYKKSFPLPESEVELLKAAKKLPRFLPQRKFKQVPGNQPLTEDESVIKAQIFYHPSTQMIERANF